MDMHTKSFLSLLFLAVVEGSFGQGSTVQVGPQQTFTAPTYSRISSNAGTYAFYYPWYASLNWSDVLTQMNPQLGRYYTKDPGVIDQHMTWAKQAGLAGFIVSWWGLLDARGARVESLMPSMLSSANAKGLKLMLMIDKYSGRTPATVASDIATTSAEYGSTPGWYLTTKGSLWLNTTVNRPVYYVYAPDNGQGLKPADWTATLNSIHSQSNAIVLAQAGDPAWVSQGHFDGVFDYSYSLPFQTRNYSSRLPARSWYVPTATPGFDAYRNKGFTTVIKRSSGQYYDSAWKNLFDQGVQILFASVTSFNEWFESTSIEPAGPGTDTDGFVWETFAPVAPTYYLDRTKYWATKANTYAPDNYGVATTVYTQLGPTNVHHGLYQNNWGSDGITIGSTAGGQVGRTPQSGCTKVYLQINKHYGALTGSAFTIRVDFYDGAGSFYLDYNSTSATYTRTPVVHLTNSGTWKTATFTVTDAAFKGTENGYSDLRISQASGTTSLYSLVSISKN